MLVLYFRLDVPCWVKWQVDGWVVGQDGFHAPKWFVQHGTPRHTVPCWWSFTCCYYWSGKLLYSPSISNCFHLICQVMKNYIMVTIIISRLGSPRNNLNNSDNEFRDSYIKDWLHVQLYIYYRYHILVRILLSKVLTSFHPWGYCTQHGLEGWSMNLMRTTITQRKCEKDV